MLLVILAHCEKLGCSVFVGWFCLFGWGVVRCDLPGCHFCFELCTLTLVYFLCFALGSCLHYKGSWTTRVVYRFIVHYLGIVFYAYTLQLVNEWIYDVIWFCLICLLRFDQLNSWANNVEVCNSGNDENIAKWWTVDMDDFMKTLVMHSKYKPLDRFAIGLPTIHEVDENLAPLKKAMPSYFPPLCLLHMCEMRYVCFICSGRLTVSVPCVNR